MSEVIQKRIKELEWNLDYHKEKVVETRELLQILKKSLEGEVKNDRPS